MQVVALSDLHGSTAPLERARRALAEADLVLLLGDLTNFGGREEAEEVLEPFFRIHDRLLAVPGNCDRLGVNEALEAAGIALHGRGRILGDIGFFGVGGSTETPFHTPQEYTEEELGALLERGHREVRGVGRKVLVSHSPPRDTRLDGTSRGLHAGSRAIREFLSREEVDLLLCGHIHEARGADHLGKTLLLNPGPFHQGWVEIEIREGIRYRLAGG
jgi:hypothetical protein